MECEVILKNDCIKLITLGYKLIEHIDVLDHKQIEGLDKIEAHIKKDINFLSKTLDENALKKDHISGSIIYQYQELLSYFSTCINGTAVVKAFRYKSNGTSKIKNKLYVDVVSEGHKKWTKVVRRNPKALSVISSGEGDFGRKSIIDQGKEFLECARQNLRFFKSPMVEFYFASGIEMGLAKSLTDLGIHVRGKFLNESLDKEVDNVSEVLFTHISYNNPFQKQEINSIDRAAVTKLNLDVNTMISFVSGLTNGETEMHFKGKIMTEQAKEERDCPLKPTLDKIFEGKELCACESALKAFRSILEIQGGEREIKRADKFLERVRIVKDALVNPNWKLEEKGLKKKAAVIFATGISLGAPTVTASMGFVRALRNQGFNVDVIIHEPRSLSEAKGNTCA